MLSEEDRRECLDQIVAAPELEIKALKLFVFHEFPDEWHDTATIYITVAETEEQAKSNIQAKHLARMMATSKTARERKNAKYISETMFNGVDTDWRVTSCPLGEGLVVELLH
jgi:hypothetical protein